MSEQRGLEVLEEKLEREKYLSPQQMADELSVSKWTIYGWISAGKIHHKKLGRLVRIPRSEIDRLLKDADKPTLEAQLNEINMGRGGTEDDDLENWKYPRERFEE